MALTEFTEHYWLDGLEKPTALMAQFLKPTFDCLMENMRDWKEFDSYYRKLNGKIDFYCQKVIDLFRRPSGRFRVLCHGDFDIKNLMFRNNGIENDDLILVSDFQ